METIGDRLIWYYVPFTDVPIPMGGLNVMTVLSTVLTMAALFALARYAARRAVLAPDRTQMAAELYLSAFDNLVSRSLELDTRAANRRFLPLIAAMFVFLLLANVLGFIPTDFFEEPTADLNCTLALGLLAMTVSTWCGVRAKGAGGYFGALLGPLWEQERAWTGAWFAGKLSAIFFFPLNVVGEMAKVVSISFRLFGNILGSGIIIIVVTHLVWNFSWLAMGLDLFFIFFIGIIQAFVFTMLTLTYIAVAIK